LNIVQVIVKDVEYIKFAFNILLKE